MIDAVTWRPDGKGLVAFGPTPAGRSRGWIFDLEGNGGQAFTERRRVDATWQINRLGLETGEETPWTEVAPRETAGPRLSSLYLTPNGQFWVHSYSRLLIDLYVVEGIR